MKRQPLLHIGRLIAAAALLLASARLLGAWLPDEGQIAFHSTRRMVQDIYLYDVRSAQLLNLTQTRDRDERSPTWSPDGEQFVYVARGGENQSDELFLRDLRSGSNQQITADGSNSYMPNWSPDGKTIAYVVAYNRVTTMSLDGSTQPRALIRGFIPHWSPDGTQIAFTSTDVSGGAYIGIINADGSGSRFLTVGAVNYSDANFAPDNRHIVAVSSRQRSLDLYLLDSTCMPQCQDRAVRLTDNPGNDHAPDWSSDGQQIVYTCAEVDSPTTHICLLDLRTNTTRVLTTDLGSAVNDAAAWRP
jgi:Tol biopolymer transport system component